MKIFQNIATTFAAILLVGFPAGESLAAQSAPVKITLQKVGPASFASAPATSNHATQSEEIDAATVGGDADSGSGDDNHFGGVNRTLPGAKTGKGTPVKPNAKPKSNPQLGVNFQGLDHFNQRFANNGNQFSTEPPDQGLCVGNGFVLETVNDVLRVYHTDGTPATGVVDLNTFYGYPAAVNRQVVPRTFGPSITDPSCIYDSVIGRFIHIALTLDRAIPTSQALAGPNHIDIAVSDTGDPTGSWTVYMLPVQNDGTQGTPDHGCQALGANGALVHGPCLGDYPHIGFDANGIYLTTNEFDLDVRVGNFHGAQVYGIGHNVITGGVGGVVLFDTLGAGPDGAGFTVWPAQGTQFNGAQGGTESFLSSRAVFSDDGTSTSILMWSMTNTKSLNTASPSPSLSLAQIDVDQYAVPPNLFGITFATQPAGNHPLSDCIADQTLHPNCNTQIAGIGTHDNSNFFGVIGGPEFVLNANDSRMQQVWFANGKLWGALDTAVNVGGEQRAGIAYYAINPNSGKISLQGQVGVAGTDLTYPAVAVTQSGRGVIAFTLTGDSNYPSAAFAGVDDKVGMGDIQIAAPGAGAWDGFTGILAYGAGEPRWGDYGAAVVDGQTIWIASEYAAQTCTYAVYFADSTCGGTRSALSNWSTHISHVTP